MRRIVRAADTEGRDAHRDGRDESEEQHDLEGYSPGVVEYYGQSHEHEDSEAGSIEAEYHQPPKPAEAKLGETITLTGTEIGVRFDVTVTDVKPVEDDLMAVYVTLKSTGIAIYDRPMEQASITYPGEEATPLDTEASAECSNGLDGIVRIDVLRSRKGCLLFPRSGDKLPERFQLALEVVPTDRRRHLEPAADSCNFCQMTGR